MGIRILLLYVVVLAIVVYAWRDWYMAFCAAIALSAVTEHSDMPRAMFGIPGVTPWNVLLLGIAIPWLIQRHIQGVRWAMPRGMLLVTVGYVLVIVVSGVRGALDAGSIDPLNTARIASTPGHFAIEHLLNPFKLLLPAAMVYDGARTRRRVAAVMIAVGVMGALYAFMVARRIDPGFLFEGQAHLRARLKLQRSIGLHANDLAMILTAVAWGTILCGAVWKELRWKVACFLAALVSGTGMVLCFSRAAYLACGAVAFVVGALRWRWLFLVIPALLLVVPLTLPNVAERMLAGHGQVSASGKIVTDLDVATAGRVTDLWPGTIRQIAQSPVVGYGRRAILRTPLYSELTASHGDCPSHPHNAYLEILLDGGVVSLAAVLGFFGGVWWISAVLFTKGATPLVRGLGGASLAFATVQLVTAMSAQSFYPKRSMVAMFCVFALAARVWQAHRATRAAFRPSLASASLREEMACR